MGSPSRAAFSSGFLDFKLLKRKNKQEQKPYCRDPQSINHKILEKKRKRKSGSINPTHTT
jgi:hypothetical protein